MGKIEIDSALARRPPSQSTAILGRTLGGPLREMGDPMKLTNHAFPKRLVSLWSPPFADEELQGNSGFARKL